MQTAFDYVPRDTFVHRLNPATKMVFVILTLGVVMIPYAPRWQDMKALLLWLSLTGILWAVAHISPKQFYGVLKILTGTFVFVILIQAFMYRGTHILIRFGKLQIPGGADLGVITQEGLFFGILLCVRILVAVGALPLFVVTTSSSKIMAVLQSLKIPPKLTFMFVSSLTFTSLIFEIWESIIEAQKLRAFDIDSMTIWQKAKRAYVPVLVPMILLLFRKGNDLQIALESRAFGSPAQPTQMEEVPMKVNDYLAFMVMTVVFAGVLYLKFH
ncbi:MAG: energy-coupling factor transporter transmembrane protein EcfT [Firmicutes bacterium]|nr:energy-coupling factor transporter transmembrane protein EcfT [Bacillota bacterium]